MFPPFGAALPHDRHQGRVCLILLVAHIPPVGPGWPRVLSSAPRGYPQFYCARQPYFLEFDARLCTGFKGASSVMHGERIYQPPDAETSCGEQLNDANSDVPEVETVTSEKS